MKNHPNAVVIHAYFNIKPAQLDTVKAMLPKFVERVSTEPKCIFYGFTMHEDELCCQEAYEGAEGSLAHLDNVRELLGQLFELADFVRLEIHGPAAELDKLQQPLAGVAPTPKYFTWQCGLE